MANIADVLGLVTKTITQNSGSITDTINNAMNTVKKVATTKAIQAKYKPGQMVSAADNATLQKTYTPTTVQPTTSISMPSGTSKTWEQLNPQEQVNVASKEPDFMKRVQLSTSAMGSALLDLNKQQTEQTATAVKKTLDQNQGKPSWETKAVQTLSGVFTAPSGQMGEGLKALSGGEDLRQQPRVVSGLTGIIFGGLGATPGGVAFNAVISHPDIKPIADSAFGLLDTAKQKINSLPIIKNLPEEVKAGLGTAIDLTAFALLHKGLKMPFKTTELVEATHPITGKTVQLRVPVDTAGWRAFKQTLGQQIEQIKTDPIGFLKQQQVGMSIQDMSNKKLPQEVYNSQAASEVLAEMQNSAPGDRFPIGTEGTASYKSTFPDWVPEGKIRNSKLFRQVEDFIMRNTVPETKALRDLYNIATEEIHRRFVEQGGVEAPLPTEKPVIESKPVPEFKPMTEAEAKAMADSNFENVTRLNEQIKAKQEQQNAQIAESQKAVVAGNEGVESLKNELPKSNNPIKAIDKYLNPLKYADEPVKKAWTDLQTENTIANEKANAEFDKLNHIPVAEAPKLIEEYQAGLNPPGAAEIKAVFDAMREEGISRGLPIDERQNYLPGVYANTVAEITKAVEKKMIENGVKPAVVKDYIEGKPLPSDISNSLKMSPSFTKEKAFSSYAEAKKYGLTPKYEHPAQLAAHYRMEMEKSLANRKFIETLKENGSLSTEKLDGYKPLDVSFSKNEQLYAKPKLARTLNEYFRDENNLGIGQKIVKGAAKTNKFLMELGLSAGIPFTSSNFFTTSQIIKSLTAGETRTIGNFVLSNSNKATKNFFIEKRDIINKMAEQNIDLSNRTGNWDNAYKQLSSATGLGKVFSKIGETFGDAFNKKTFDNYMPMQIISTFENTYKALIEKGVSESEASKMAGDVTKKFQAIPEDWGRSRTTAEVINAVFFAPRFRESVVKLLWNTGESIVKFKDPTFSMNRKFLAGAAVTLIGMNLLNKQTMGRYMYENPTGHEFELGIPYGDGQIVYIPMLPSILAFPRNMISGGIATATGDWDTAKQKFGSLLSMPAKIGTELWANQDWAGKAIYTPDGSVAEKMKDIAAYIGVGNNHPYVKELYTYFASPDAKKKDAFQIMSSLLELPAKFSTATKEQTSEFYSQLDKKKQQEEKAKQPVQEFYDNLQKLKAEGKIEEAQNMLAELSDEEYAIYKDIKSAAKTKATKTLEVKMNPVYREIRKLKESGNVAEAQAKVDAMTDEEYKAYKLLKTKFDSIDLSST